MSASVSYEACSVKRRRSTKDEMAALYAARNSIVDSRPSDVWGCRQIYYQTVVRGLVEKSDKNANRIGAALIHMRDNGLLDPDRIEDESREILDGRDGFGVETSSTSFRPASSQISGAIVTCICKSGWKNEA